MKTRFILIGVLSAVVMMVSACASVLEQGALLPTLSAPLPGATVDPATLPTAAPRNTPAPQATVRATESVAATPADAEVASMDPSIVARVNGVEIARATFDAQFSQARTYLVQQAGFDPSSEEGQLALLALQRQVLDWLVDQVLIEQAAQSAGIQVTEAAIEAQLLRIRGDDQGRYEAWLGANGLTEAALREQLRVDLTTARVRDKVTGSLVRSAPQVHTRHILLTDGDAAREAHEKLAGGADFATLARQISEDGTTRDSGGDLGFLPQGIMPPAYDAVAFVLAPGEISDVIQSDFGYHIIQVIETVANREIPESLWPVVQQRAFEDWLAEQRAAADLFLNTN